MIKSVDAGREVVSAEVLPTEAWRSLLFVGAMAGPIEQPPPAAVENGMDGSRGRESPEFVLAVVLQLMLLRPPSPASLERAYSLSGKALAMHISRVDPSLMELAKSNNPAAGSHPACSSQGTTSLCGGPSAASRPSGAHHPFDALLLLTCLHVHCVSAERCGRMREAGSLYLLAVKICCKFQYKQWYIVFSYQKMLYSLSRSGRSAENLSLFEGIGDPLALCMEMGPGQTTEPSLVLRPFCLHCKAVAAAIDGDDAAAGLYLQALCDAPFIRFADSLPNVALASDASSLPPPVVVIPFLGLSHLLRTGYRADCWRLSTVPPAVGAASLPSFDFVSLVRGLDSTVSPRTAVLPCDAHLHSLMSLLSAVCVFYATRSDDLPAWWFGKTSGPSADAVFGFVTRLSTQCPFVANSDSGPLSVSLDDLVREIAAGGMTVDECLEKSTLHDSRLRLLATRLALALLSATQQVPSLCSVFTEAAFSLGFLLGWDRADVSAVAIAASCGGHYVDGVFTGSSRGYGDVQDRLQLSLLRKAAGASDALAAISFSPKLRLVLCSSWTASVGADGEDISMIDVLLAASRVPCIQQAATALCGVSSTSSDAAVRELVFEEETDDAADSPVGNGSNGRPKSRNAMDGLLALLLDIQHRAIEDAIQLADDSKRWWKARYALDDRLKTLLHGAESEILGPVMSAVLSRSMLTKELLDEYERRQLDFLLPSCLPALRRCLLLLLSRMACDGEEDQSCGEQQRALEAVQTLRKRYPLYFVADFESWMGDAMRRTTASAASKTKSRQSSRRVASREDERNVLASIAAQQHPPPSSRISCLCDFLRLARQEIDGKQLPCGSDLELGSRLFLTIDSRLQRLPLESLPSLEKRRVVRLLVDATAHTLHLPEGINATEWDPSRAFFLVNPSGDLVKSEQKMHEFIDSLCPRTWNGIFGRPPSDEEFARHLAAADVFLFCGHGTGPSPVSRTSLFDKPGVAALRAASVDAASDLGSPQAAGVRVPVVLLMGCSSGRVETSTGYPVTARALSWVRQCGAFLVVGNLWDVTDGDLDRFTQTLVVGLVDEESRSAFPAMDRARASCKLRYLTGAAPVVYGIPFQTGR